MDALLIFTLMSIMLVVLFFLGVPIYASFLICNLAGVLLLLGGTIGFGLFVNSMTSTSTSPSLVTLPLFIFMGEILLRANAIDALMEGVDKLMGRIRARHYIVALIISTIMGALNGAAIASAAMLSRTMYPVMMSRGYDRRMTLGLIMGGACLAPIIPPSILAIIIGTTAQTSIGDLLLAGTVPGLLIAAMMMAYVVGKVTINPSLAPRPDGYSSPTLRDVYMAFLQLLPFALVIVMVMGSMLGGIATPSESAAAGVIGSMIVAAVFGRFSAKMVLESLQSTAIISCTIMIIMVSSQLFSQLLAFSGTAQWLQQAVTSLNVSSHLMLFIMMFIPFLLAMFIDEVAVILILVPIYLPLLGIFDFPPLWFWTLFLINMALGAIAPPVGYALFVMRGILPEVTLFELYNASIPYVVIYILAIALMGLFPLLVLYPFQ